jgi:hypothetical protein
MPGFPGACPEYFDCSLDVWVTLAATLTYALLAETALLSVLVARSQRLKGRGIPAALLVGLSTLIAIACVGWLSQIAPHTFVAPFIHITPDLRTHLRQDAVNKLTRDFVPISILAFAFVLGTSTTAVALIRSAFVTTRNV